MDSKTEKQIFKNGSKTYYNSSFFFPKNCRDDVYKLYSFVRVVDDFVDEKPFRYDMLEKIKKAYAGNKSMKLDILSQQILANINYLEKKYKFDKRWIQAFLQSMEMDATGFKYQQMPETLKYIYGSAEVIGLMMAKILGLNEPEPLNAAKLQGRAMQYINFIRDIDEDINLGRCYFPLSQRKQYGLEKWNKTIADKPGFNEFIKDQINIYSKWQKEAEIGWPQIPYRSRIAVITASNSYNWTAEQIYKDPSVVFKQKVKPSRAQILLEGLKVCAQQLF